MISTIYFDKPQHTLLVCTPNQGLNSDDIIFIGLNYPLYEKIHIKLIVSQDIPTKLIVDVYDINRVGKTEICDKYITKESRKRLLDYLVNISKIYPNVTHEITNLP